MHTKAGVCVLVGKFGRREVRLKVSEAERKLGGREVRQKGSEAEGK